MATTVTPPASFTFQTNTVQQLTWNLVDISGNPITGATVTATLYLNRSRIDPTNIPGTPDPNFNNINLTETPTLSGTYVGTIPEAFNPIVGADSWFILVITASQGSSILRIFEIPAVVTPDQNEIDLVQLDDVKNWLGFTPSNTSCDGILQICITSFSQYVINATGIESFKKVSQYTEVYDGNGNNRLFLDNRPINSLISVLVGSYSVPLSTSTITPGIYVERSKKSIAFRDSGFTLTAPLSIYPYVFARGTGNVQVTYTAGYTSVPFDLQEITIETVAQNYKRREWIDLASKNVSAQGIGGTTVYRSWAMTPFAESVINFYSRYRTA